MDLALGLLLVRLIGFGLAAHGAQKVFGWFGGYGLAGTGGFMESLGFSSPARSSRPRPVLVNLPAAC